MATVKLTDIIDVVVFQDLPAVNSPELTAFYTSGVVAKSPILDQHTANPGFVTEMPFWRDLDANSEPNVGSDDPSDVAQPDKVDQGEQIARKAFLNKGWSASDLAREVAMGEDAMTHIRNRSDTYWTRQWQRRLVATSIGVLLDNVANDGSDMVFDISIEDGNAATVDNLISRTSVVSAAFTMGDQFEGLRAMAMHSVVYERLVENDQIEFIPDSEGNMTIPTYLGRRVILDDGTPVIAGTTSGQRYITVLFGEGALGYGEAEAITPVAVEREESQGGGQGIETLWTRKVWTIHPFGYQFAGTPTKAAGATLAELASPTFWTRVVDRKNVPLAYLITNG